MEGSDHDVGGGVKGVAKTVCVKETWLVEDLKLEVWSEEKKD